MPEYALFLAEADHGETLPVQAMVDAHVMDIIRAGQPHTHPLVVIAAEHLEGVNQSQLLADWCGSKGC